MRILSPRVGVAVIALALLCAACGSTPPATTTTTTTVRHARTTRAPLCGTALLAITARFGGTASGTSYYRFDAKNTSPSSCALDGYPSLAFFAPNASGGANGGAPVEIKVTDSGAAPQRVVLAPGGSAEFILVFTDVPVNGSGCVSVASVNVTPPRQHESKPVAVSFQPCGGVARVEAFAEPGTENP